jgi:DNA-directed RNA polymerase subunit E'/Rpb7
MISSPYVKTYLFTTVKIMPQQMDNNIMKHIKSNLKRNVEGRNFYQYGFVNKIHDVYADKKNAYVIPEDPTSSVEYKVKFGCTMCYPLNSSIIVGTVRSAIESMMYVTNGPLLIVVNAMDSINKSVFSFNGKLNTWLAKKDSKETTSTSASESGTTKYVPIKEGIHVKIRIINKKITAGEDKIICLGYLEDLATPEEVKNNISDEYSVSKEVEMTEYIDVDNIVLNAEENADTDTDEETDTDSEKDF